MRGLTSLIFGWFVTVAFIVSLSRVVLWMLSTGGLVAVFTPVVIVLAIGGIYWVAEKCKE